MTLINCENITLSYDGKSVISNLSFSVSQGDYLCVIGENGAGKSTLTKGILGLLKPNSGKITFENGLLMNEIGYLPQQSDIQKDFPASVKEVVISGCLNKCGFLSFYKKEHKDLASKNMRLLGIDSLKDKCYQELSGGQQQRVLLARALCAAKKMIILDEPVAGLDPVVTNELYSAINFLNKKHNLSVIMVSHDLHGALTNATHILHLGNNDYFFSTVGDYKKSEYAKKFSSPDNYNI